MHIIILITAILLLGLPQAFATPQSAASLIPVSTGGLTRTVADNKPVKKPSRGMSMRKVERLFGEPKEKMLPTGNPPITRWVYDSFTVYFEGKYVIHAVKNRPLSEVNDAR